MSGPQRSSLKRVEGVWLPEHFAPGWGDVKAFSARGDDLLIATYPKAGTTWTQEIVDLIISGGDAARSQRAPTHIRIPFLEMPQFSVIPSGLQLLDKMESPRVIKTHLPFQMIPPSFWEQNCKVIYVARNAKDNAVSYFHFDRMNLAQPDPGPWPHYLTMFMEGQVGWGSWYEHVTRFWEERERHRILYLFYEDMKEDPKREILRLVSFLGESLDEETVDAIVELTSFDAMKLNNMSNYTSFAPEILDQNISPFMRKGAVGDWRNHFTVQQNSEFESHYNLQMKNSTLKFRFEI